LIKSERSAAMSENHFEAALWDLDGVIADTEEFHYQAWRDVFAKKGVDFTMAEFMRHFGQRHDTIIRDTLGDSVTPAELIAINAEKQADYRRRVADHIQPLPGAIALIRSIQEHGIKQAIASSSPQENIVIILRGLGIENCFQAITWGTEVPEGKPSPQIYLLAARKLGIKPANCVVFEDALAGVDGAKRAGMKCVAVTNSHPESKLQKADLIVDTLEAVSVADLVALFRSSHKTKK
jgi:beta-phosphoglucomutase family hydrolase